MARIARGGPRFQDFVLEHAQALRDPNAEADIDEPIQPATSAMAYNYIPESVLGDWQYEVEPNWRQMDQMPLLEFFQGLRQRNWTDRRRYDPKSEPWRLQLYRCGYESDPTGWTGLRAVITTPASTSGGSNDDGEMQRRWVSMPDSGPLGRVSSAEVSEPGRVGYNDVLVQLYQAYSQVLPRDARKHLKKHGYVPSGKFKYQCPGEKLLDVSYHWAAAQSRPALVR